MKLRQGWLKVLLGEGGDRLSLKPLQWLCRVLLTSVLFFLLCSFPLTSRLLSHSLPPLRHAPAPSLEVTPGLLQRTGSSSEAACQHRSLGPSESAQIHQVLCIPLTNTQHSSFPCSSIIVFWVKIWPFSFAVNSSKKLIRVTQRRVSFLPRWGRDMRVGPALCSIHSSAVQICGRDSSLSRFQLSHQAVSDL